MVRVGTEDQRLARSFDALERYGRGGPFAKPDGWVSLETAALEVSKEVGVSPQTARTYLRNFQLWNVPGFEVRGDIYRATSTTPSVRVRPGATMPDFTWVRRNRVPPADWRR